MKICEYVCLKCGTNFKIELSSSSDKRLRGCPKCNSTNTASLSPASFFNFEGGG